MNRLGVFVFFDHNGTLDCYVEVLLKSLYSQCQKLVIVINGIIQFEALKTLKTFTNDILIRENIGFDAGAYKDIFVNHFSLTQIKEFDEIVLSNDTFYGPLYPLEGIWENFDGEEIDFWGMTKHPKGTWEDGKMYPEHIQSYFLVIKKNMLCSNEFHAFWKDMPYALKIRDAIDEFEIKFTTYFSERGFYGKTLMDMKELTFLMVEGKSPYLYNSFQLIKDVGVPFLKRNSLCIANEGYSNALNALKYVEHNLDYNVQLIWRNILRLSKENCFSTVINYLKLERFYVRCKRVYIYGTGRYGKNIAEYFACKGWIFDGFIVSENQSNEDENVYKFNQIKLERKDGIILALGKNAFKDVYPNVKKVCEEHQLFKLSYN